MKISRSAKVFAVIVMTMLVWTVSAQCFWFGSKKEEKQQQSTPAKNKEADAAKVVQTPSDAPDPSKPKSSIAVKNTEDGSVVTRTPAEVWQFNQKILEERALFEKKYARLEMGPKAKKVQEFNEQQKLKDKQLNEQLAKLPPDQKEQAATELSRQIDALNKAYREKIKSIGVTEKEKLKKDRKEQYQKEKKEFDRIIAEMPPDPAEQTRVEFEAQVQQKMREFYSKS